MYDEHLRRNISVYLFNIANDATESHNLANSSAHADKLKELLSFYNSFAAKPDTVMGLSWRYGFQDPHAGTVPPDPEGQHCTGEFNARGGSPYCHFGREWECFVRGRQPSGGSSLGTAGAASTAACQAACAAKDGCEWWVLRNSTADGAKCELVGAASGAEDCDRCDMGPKTCPGMGGAPQRRAMTGATVRALLHAAGTPAPSRRPEAWQGDALEELARLDAAGYFNRAAH